MGARFKGAAARRGAGRGARGAAALSLSALAARQWASCLARNRDRVRMGVLVRRDRGERDPPGPLGTPGSSDHYFGACGSRRLAGGGMWTLLHAMSKLPGLQGRQAASLAVICFRGVFRVSQKPIDVEWQRM